ncbi:hypothetical protein D9758_011674 [Tetrapyrgos nigripes]|uniref:ATP-dependent DNA helicase n=1 Tax=Tetrapyrgos nigripes TaxID=182062 RepID=A0A8H5LM85_9AGAR|nr:hypothetical protein D9758_011674 [Tetrapyrgos nigripes]
MRVLLEGSLIDAIYPDLSTLSTAPPPKFFMDQVILAPWNSDVDATNAELLSHLPGEEHVYMRADSIIREQGTDRPDDNPIPPEYYTLLMLPVSLLVNCMLNQDVP